MTQFNEQNIINAPRTQAWALYPGHGEDDLFGFDLDTGRANRIKYNLKIRDIVLNRRPSCDMEDFEDCLYRGWSPKEAYKIASGHWNDSNHPGIESWLPSKWRE